MLFTPVKPMLLSNYKATPFSLADPNLLYEIKYDGWRLLLHKEGARVEIYTRHGNVVTNRFPEFIEAARLVPAQSLILDCEGVCFCPKKLRPDFEMFSARAKLTNPVKIMMAARNSPATLIPFDVLMLDGHNLTANKLLVRKNYLSQIVSNSPAMMLSTYIIGEGQRLYDWTLEHKWEGIVSKRVASRYSINSRSESWIKKKHTVIAEGAIILGYQVNPFALVIGLDNHVPVAIVEFGFSPEEKVAFRRIATQIHTTKKKKTQMIEPLLKCNVEYLEKTDNGALRICTFRGFIT